MNQKSRTTKAANPGCVSVAVAILGDKWTPYIICTLVSRNLRFCRLQEAVGGVNPRTLSARLSYLEDTGIITKVALSGDSPYAEYALTQKGRDLIPILERMAEWGARYAPNQNHA